MSFRDKINNKFNKPKQEQVLPFQNFDQTSIIITSFGGQSQLCPIKLNCTWSSGTTSIRPPELNCNWYNRTQTSLNEIEGIRGPYYQPCLADVGSIIHIQCIPVLQGVDYEGMPIIKDIGPIKVDPETEEQANDLMEGQKATFSIKIKQVSQNKEIIDVPSEGLLKVIKLNLKIIRRQNEEEKQISSIEMNENYPQFICSRVNSKQMKVLLSENNYVKLQFTNNKVRDVFCLHNKFLIAQRQSEDEAKTGTTQEFVETSKNEEQQKGLQKRQEEKKEEKQVRSSEQLITLKKMISSPGKQSASQFMQISELKKQIRKIENENYQLKKNLNEKNEVIMEFQDKLNQAKERQTNLSKNYFQLEEQLNSAQHSEGKATQQISFYQNEYRIMKSENQNFQKKISELKKKNNELENKLIPYISQQQTYEEVQEKYKLQVESRKEFESKYDYLKEENQKYEEKMNDLKETLSEFQAEKKFYQKRYQSISNELQFQFSGAKSIIKEKSAKSFQSEGDKEFLLDKMEKQILQLKKQLKEIVEENNYLRTLNLKQKKSSSKAQLKGQLVELKKLANRLAETVTQKDLALEHMRKINKDLNERVMELNRFQFENEEMVKSHISKEE